MVQLVLDKTFRKCILLQVLCLVIFLASANASWRSKQKDPEPTPPDLLLDGGRKLVFERAFASEREVKIKKGFWTKLVDIVAGEPDYHYLVRPYGIVADSHGRLIVTDPGARGVHIFDFGQQKYKFLQRWDKDKDPMLSPQCVAVDAQDRIYVTDSESGKIFVFDASGKFQHALGSLHGGEGYFKRPTGIGVDSEGQHIYVTDTLRDQVFILDMKGAVVKTIGQRGTGNSEFNFPADLLFGSDGLSVVDTMNSRIQNFDRSGVFLSAMGSAGEEPGQLFRPKGIAKDSEDHLYIVDALQSSVQVFNSEGQLLYSFGGRGSRLGEFSLPVGLSIDHSDRIYVVDSYNRRVQVFHYFPAPKVAEGEKH
jgi:DNA-binding beta-propeller fold protein YncE